VNTPGLSPTSRCEADRRSAAGSVFRRRGGAFLCLLWLACFLAISPANAQQPLLDLDLPPARPLVPLNDMAREAYLATITGVFAGAAADLPEIDTQRWLDYITVEPFPERPVPPIFWYYRNGLRTAFLRQPGAAPLAIIIGGIGSSISAPSSITLSRLLYGLGYHILILPSPTQTNFIVTASTTHVPGRPADDARDLHRVMQMLLAEIRRRVEVTGVDLVGFSLGGLHAAYVAALDDEQGGIGIERTVLVNPPVDLVTSARILDRLLDRYIERDRHAVDRFVSDVFNAFARVYLESEATDISPEMLYRTVRIVEDRVDLLEQLIGFAFRLATSNLSFTSDVLTHRGYLVPADARPGITTSLTDVFKVSLDLGLTSYIEEVALPFFSSRDPSLTERELLAETRLEALTPFLRDEPGIFAITSEDDIILGRGDLATLERLLGERLIVLPTGGHGGSITTPDFAAALAGFLER
jgi:pimeloyl-ACP methyl ester carboxylesterase